MDTIGVPGSKDGWFAVGDTERVAEALEGKGFEATPLTNYDADALETQVENFFIDKGNDLQAWLFVWFAGRGHTERGQRYLVRARSCACTIQRRGSRSSK